VSKVLIKLKIIVTGLLLVAMLAVSVSTAMAPVADTAGEVACAYKGYAFLSSDDSNPVPDGTAIRAMQGATEIGQTTTGPSTWGGFANNQFYMDDNVLAQPGSTVNFQIWDAGASDWANAIEDAVHVQYGSVDVNLHTGTATIAIDSTPYLFVYPGPDCALPGAVNNIDGTDCQAVTIWGVEGGSWRSFDVELSVGSLITYGLDAGQAYVITHEDCVGTDWELCN